MSTKDKRENSRISDPKAKVRYRDTLETITRARYMEKLRPIDDKDPYEMEKSEWTTDMMNWPEVTYPDIVNYLVYTQSAYTLAELKAYKSLQAYNYFVSGFVQDIGQVCINGKSVFLGKVKHSQRMTDPCLRPWLIVENDGSISSAHCTCMAGIGEVCSHVGALLFAIEASVKIRNTKTVTEEKAYWMLPNAVNKVEYKRVQDIDFTSAKTKKRKLDQAIAEDSPMNSGPRQRKLPTAQEPTEDELKNFFTDLSTAGTKPVVLSLVPQFAQSYKPQALDKKYPTVLSELYNEDCSSLQRDVLLKHCEDAFSKIFVTAEEAVNCEVATREQANCKQWFHFRTGRITASLVKRVCRTSTENPSKSLIKDICYPIGKKFSSKATEWGCEHEKRLAVKISDSIDCLQTVNNNLELRRTHQYYYQVQCQLLVTMKEFCDFVVWTNEDMLIERVVRDTTLCEEITRKCEEFFKAAILPELIGKLYSRPFQEQVLTPTSPGSNTGQDKRREVICVCQKEYDEDSDNVIGCDNENCPFVWLHFKCAGIERVPKGKWLCKHCKTKKKSA
uniref:Uncharacterized protein LOC111113467 n=1 Tax=Crassostrea virginica TaxID=6565 RepID=A0A8B8BX77_CRAVI|nr:uncharacterized protein LOC111113467 [Crassostrea virginica]